jgi:hypothetical protein
VMGESVNRYVNYTRVTDPDSRTTFYYFSDFQTELEDCYKCGLLQKKIIMEPDATPLKLNRQSHILCRDKYMG